MEAERRFKMIDGSVIYSTFIGPYSARIFHNNGSANVDRSIRFERGGFEPTGSIAPNTLSYCCDPIVKKNGREVNSAPGMAQPKTRR
jgi:hypothetical protein